MEPVLSTFSHNANFSIIQRKSILYSHQFLGPELHVIVKPPCYIKCKLEKKYQMCQKKIVKRIAFPTWYLKMATTFVYNTTQYEFFRKPVFILQTPIEWINECHILIRDDHNNQPVPKSKPCF